MTARSPLQLELLPIRYAVARLAPDAAIPDWARDPTFCVIARTGEELSIICGEATFPATDRPPILKSERGFRVLRVVGSLDFEQIGIFASMAGPLADAGISIFPVATFDTDYIMVREDNLPRALEVLRIAGHTVHT